MRSGEFKARFNCAVHFKRENYQPIFDVSNQGFLVLAFDMGFCIDVC
jgi:hypothetical protein